MLPQVPMCIESCRRASLDGSEAGYVKDTWYDSRDLYG